MNYYYDPDTELRVDLPTHWQICDYCHGDGYSTLHGMEITPEDWDQEELDEYAHGTAYRTPCRNDDCQNGKVRTVDESRCTPIQLELWYAEMQEIYQMNAISAMERRMGA